jgi:hypothetical protein
MIHLGQRNLRLVTYIHNFHSTMLFTGVSFVASICHGAQDVVMLNLGSWSTCSVSHGVVKEPWWCSGWSGLTSSQEVPGSNPTIGVRLWVSLFASIASPRPGVKGVPYSSGIESICVCVACSNDLELQLGLANMKCFEQALDLDTVLL